MLSSGMQESRNATIEVNDAHPSEVAGLIQCIYTGMLPETSLLAPVFELAHKYMLPEDTTQALGHRMLKEMDKSNIADFVRVIRKHASPASKSSELWNAVLKKLRPDWELTTGLVQDLIDGPPSKKA